MKSFHVTKQGISGSILCLVAATALWAPGSMAEAEDTVGEATQEESHWSDRFRFHGFLNVGYGVTDGVKYRGATENGSADFRYAAFQSRFQLAAHSEIVLQLSHERVGTSPTNQFRDDVEVDWLFLSHEFSDGTGVRLGRVPLPIGFYNEIKDVGTALPFYRPSGNFYGEGTWTSDSVDGVVVSRDFDLPGDWIISAEAYFGDWERIETDGDTLSFGVADIHDALGFYAWLEPPSGLWKVGFGANRFTAQGGVYLAPDATDDEKTRYFSLQIGEDPLQVRFEISRRDFTGGYWQPYYVEALYRATGRLSFSALYDVGFLHFEVPFFATFDDKIEELFGLGASFAVTPNLVVKLEHHWIEGYGQVEDRELSIFFDEPVKVNLLMASLSASF